MDQNLERVVGERAERLAIGLRKKAKRARKEEEIRVAVERELALIADEAGITLEGDHEFTLAKGQVDSVYDRMIIEYKNPSSAADRIGETLASTGSKKVVTQIKRRFRAMKDEHGHALHTLFGVGLDGRRIIFIRHFGERWLVEEPCDFNPPQAKRFLWALFNLSNRGKPYSPTFLADDFGGSSEVARRAVSALYKSASAISGPKARVLFDEWRLLFSEVCGYEVDKLSEKMRLLADAYDISERGLNLPALLYALHTYYAFLMKVLAAEVVGFFHGLPTVRQRLARAGPDFDSSTDIFLSRVSGKARRTRV